MEVYIIKDWDETYENNRSKEIKNPSWVPIPNKLYGDGYSLIMDEKDGASIYGSWIAMVCIAQRCDVRGTLMRDTGEPHNIDSISRMTRISKKEIKRMIEFSINNTKWLILKDLETGATISHEGAIKSHEDTLIQNRTEQNRIEQKGQENLFDNFRTKYPGSKRGNETEFDDFKKHKDWKKILPLLESAIDKQIQYKKYLKNTNKFCPEWKNLKTWLNQRCWEEVIPEYEKEEKWFD